MMENDLFEEIMALLDSDDLGKTVAVIEGLTQFMERNSSQISSSFINIMRIAAKTVEYKITVMENDPYQLKKGFDYLSRYCSAFNDTISVRVEEPVIWWCWLQGLESAPPIVKACYHSLGILNMKVIVITSENYDQYVNIPEYILEKWKAGIISNTHFSDILRLELLTTRGGVWLDATVLVTGDQNIKWLLDKKLFVFSHIMRAESRYIRASNWLIASDGNSRILRSTKKMLYSYWENESVISNYFLFHLLFTMACTLHKEEWHSVPVINNVSPHILQEELLQGYTEERWRQLCWMSDFHKLTYKNIGAVTKGSFYDHIIKTYGTSMEGSGKRRY